MFKAMRKRTFRSADASTQLGCVLPKVFAVVAILERINIGALKAWLLSFVLGVGPSQVLKERRKRSIFCVPTSGLCPLQARTFFTNSMRLWLTCWCFNLRRLHSEAQEQLPWGR